MIRGCSLHTTVCTKKTLQAESAQKTGKPALLVVWAADISVVLIGSKATSDEITLESSSDNFERSKVRLPPPAA